MSQEILISKDNAFDILNGFMANINKAISEKDISSPYINKFNLADKIKIDGTGNMFLFNNGEYIKLDSEKLNITKENIDTIYDLFKIDIGVTTEGWEPKADIPQGTGWSPASAIYNDKIFYIGGSNGAGNNKNFCYDVSTNTWSTKTDLPTGRYQLNYSGICDDNIYVIGGRTESYYLSTHECYNITTNTWSVKTNIPVVSSGFSSCVYNRKIYCIGGMTTYDSTLNTNRVYDIDTNTWSSVVGMPSYRYDFASLIYKDKIFIICGYNSGVSLINECYDITTNTWSTKAPLPTTAKSAPGYSIYEDKIFIFGGYIGGTSPYLNNNDCYDISTNTWSSKLNLIEARSGTAAQTYKDKIYLIGGYPGNVRTDCYSVSHKYSNYDLVLPSSIQDKLDIIKEDGTGSLVLSNNGEYVNIIPSFTIINDSDIDDLISKLTT